MRRTCQGRLKPALLRSDQQFTLRDQHRFPAHLHLEHLNALGYDIRNVAEVGSDGRYVMQARDNSLTVFRKRRLFRRAKLSTRQGHGAPPGAVLGMARGAAGGAVSNCLAEARLQAGSSSHAAMDAMLEELDAALAAHERWSESARSRADEAEAALLARARELA